MATMNTIYIVFQHEGQYDSHCETALKGFTTETAALAYIETLKAADARYNAIIVPAAEKFREWRKLNPTGQYYAEYKRRAEEASKRILCELGVPPAEAQEFVVPLWTGAGLDRDYTTEPLEVE